MESVSIPHLDIRQMVTREGLLVLLRLGRRLFLFLVIIALVTTFPLPEPDRDWQDPQRQPSMETPGNVPSSATDITVIATPNYHGSS